MSHLSHSSHTDCRCTNSRQDYTAADGGDSQEVCVTCNQTENAQALQTCTYVQVISNIAQWFIEHIPSSSPHDCLQQVPERAGDAQQRPSSALFQQLLVPVHLRDAQPEHVPGASVSVRACVVMCDMQACVIIFLVGTGLLLVAAVSNITPPSWLRVCASVVCCCCELIICSSSAKHARR